MIFGTSKYVSIGSFAIVSLMTGVSCRNIYEEIERDYLAAEIRYVDQAHHHHISLDFNNLTDAVPKIIVSQEELVQLVTLVSGIIQISMALLRIEFMASYLSDQLVSGFCTGAAVHVVAVQVNKLLQVNVTKSSGPGYLIKVSSREAGSSCLIYIFLVLVRFCSKSFNHKFDRTRNLNLQFHFPLRWEGYLESTIPSEASLPDSIRTSSRHFLNLHQFLFQFFPNRKHRNC